MKIKRAFCTDCYEWRNVVDLELWEEKPGVMVCDTCGNALVELADEEEKQMKGYKQRMVDEYKELKERVKKLGNMLLDYEHGELDFEPNCPINLLETQWHTMLTYLYILEQCAEIENIDLEA